MLKTVTLTVMIISVKVYRLKSARRGAWDRVQEGPRMELAHPKAPGP